MLKNNNYYYQDKYMFFTFNNIYSKDYNLFITSKDGSWNLITETGASPSFEAPQFQDKSYYLGTTRSQKSISWTVAAEGLTQPQIRKMFTWLKEGATGFLYRDIDTYWGYDVVLSKVGNPTIFSSYAGTSVIEFTLEFQTVGEFKARSRYNLTFDLASLVGGKVDGEECYKFEPDTALSNEYGIPEIVKKEDRVQDSTSAEGVIIYQNQKEYSLFLPFVSNEYLTVDCAFDWWTNNSDVTVAYSYPLVMSENLWSYTGQNSEERARICKYWSEHDLLTVDDSTLIENTANLVISRATTNGIKRIQTIAPVEFVFKDGVAPLEIQEMAERWQYYYIFVVKPSGNKIYFSTVSTTANADGTFDIEHIFDIVDKDGLKYYCGPYTELKITTTDANIIQNISAQIHKYNNL